MRCYESGARDLARSLADQGCDAREGQGTIIVTNAVILPEPIRVEGSEQLVQSFETKTVSICRCISQIDLRLPA